MLRQIYDIEQVIPLVRANKKSHKMFYGDIINFGTMKLRCFRRSGTKCHCCGLHGKFFLKERHNHGNGSTEYTLQLYAIRNGKEVLMTCDHIRPISKGGTGHLENLQTLCFTCNQRKADNYAENHCLAR